MESDGKAHINPNFERFSRKKRLSAEAYFDGIMAGDRVLLGQAITIIESNLPKDQELAFKILERCQSNSAASKRIGITGAPGVGKSTLLEALGLRLIKETNQKVAVLAVDPTSAISQGSILGDKTRMPALSQMDLAFIRPSPAGMQLGGVAKQTREAIILCEAAGYDWIFIETVGVGQSEYVVHELTDCFVLLLMPGAGDELQGIKRGIMEMADIIVVQKADGDRLLNAEQSKLAYQAALKVMQSKIPNWNTPVLTASALEGKGLFALTEQMVDFDKLQNASGAKLKKRQQQAVYWFSKYLDDYLKIRFFENEQVKSEFPKLKQAVRNGQLSPLSAMHQIKQLF